MAADSSLRTAADVDLPAFRRALRDGVAGTVAFDAGTRALYTADASNYRHVPLAVVVPRTVDDVAAAVAACAAHGVPVTPRGAGTSIAGNAIGPGLVIDTSRHLTAIEDVDPAARRSSRMTPGWPRAPPASSPASSWTTCARPPPRTASRSARTPPPTTGAPSAA
jgi:hypothetical protein